MDRAIKGVGEAVCSVLDAPFPEHVFCVLEPHAHVLDVDDVRHRTSDARCLCRSTRNVLDEFTGCADRLIDYRGMNGIRRMDKAVSRPVDRV